MGSLSHEGLWGGVKGWRYRVGGSFDGGVALWG